MKNKNSWLIVLIIGIFVLSITTYVYYNTQNDGILSKYFDFSGITEGINNIAGTSLAITSTCDFIKNGNDPSSEYTSVLNSDSYTCNRDECIVRGSVEITPEDTGEYVIFDKGNTNSLYNNGGLLYADVDRDGLLEQYGFDFQGTRNAIDKYEETYAKTPEGYQITLDRTYTSSSGYSYNVKIWIFQKDSNNYKYYVFKSLSSVDTTVIAPTGCGTTQTCEFATQKFLSHNFCPSSDPNFINCQGLESSVEVKSTPVTLWTAEKKLKKGESVSYNAQFSDGTQLTNERIYVKEFDCTCYTGISSGQTCDPKNTNQVYCQPSTSTYTCPPGKKLLTPGTTLSVLSGINGFTLDNYGCIKSDEYICYTPQTGASSCGLPGGVSNYKDRGIDLELAKVQNTYNTYLTCDGSQDFNGVSCPVYQTQGTCPTGQQCFVNGQLQAGVGACACSQNECDGNPLGYKKQVSETSYTTCSLQSSGCNDWSSATTCPASGGQSLIFDEESQSCVCPSTNSCSPGEAICTSNGIRSCVEVNIGGKACYQLSTANSCNGEKTCNDKGDTEFNDVCDCESVDECEIGEIRCTSANTFESCIKDPDNLQDSCYLFRNEKQTDPGFACKNDVIVEDTTFNCVTGTNPCKEGFTCITDEDSPFFAQCKLVGCSQGVNPTTGEDGYVCPNDSYGTQQSCIDNECVDAGCAYNVNPYTGEGNYTCDQTKDEYGKTIETCSQNKCVCVQDEYTATKAQFDDVNNNGDNTRCYNNNVQVVEQVGKCYRWVESKTCINKEEICVKNSPASCVPSYDFVGILGNDVYAINQLIDNLSVQLTDNFGEVEGVTITGLIYVDGVELAEERVTTFTNSNGSAKLQFSYGHPRAGNVTVSVIADPTGRALSSNRTIEIKKTLEVKLSCPIKAIVNRDTKCTFVVTDAGTGDILNIIPSINILQGTQSLSYTAISDAGKNGVSFQPVALGDVVVNAEVKANGYISAKDQTKVIVEDITTQAYIKIDGLLTTDIETIKSGQRRIRIEVEESGVPIKINSIQAKINNPAGGEVPVTFTRVDENAFEASYNFEDAGRTYTITGTIFFDDPAKANKQFTTTVNTLKDAGTAVVGSSFTPILITIIISVGVVVVFIIFIWFFSKKKR